MVMPKKGDTHKMIEKRKCEKAKQLGNTLWIANDLLVHPNLMIDCLFCVYGISMLVTLATIVSAPTASYLFVLLHDTFIFK